MRDLSFFSRLYVPPYKKAGPNLAPLLELVWNRHWMAEVAKTNTRNYQNGEKWGECNVK